MMTEGSLPTTQRKGRDKLAILIIVLLAFISVIGTYLTLTIPDFAAFFLAGDVLYTPGGAVYEVIYVLLTIATDILYLLGGAVIAFGAVLIS